jgi:hypothetical protein
MAGLEPTTFGEFVVGAEAPVPKTDALAIAPHFLKLAGVSREVSWQ